jgi:Zn-dependent protease with chaperone function
MENAKDPLADMLVTLTDDDDLGDWLHAKLAEEFSEETEAWAVERVGRVTERLNAVRTACPVPGAAPYALRTHILWVGQMNAFAAPGRWIYLTRALLQRCDGDEPVAFVLAHEMAHHDLGHVRMLGPALSKLRGLPGNLFIISLPRLLELGFRSAEREAAADSYALDLCLAAGYDGHRCLELLDILEAEALNYRDLDSVFGPDSGETPFWRWRRGYPSLRARRDALRYQLATG